MIAGFPSLSNYDLHRILTVAGLALLRDSDGCGFRLLYLIRG
jgi:hypothetical protein